MHAAKSTAGFALRVHVECQSLAEAREAIAAGADIVMLDNFTPQGIADAARALRNDWARETGEGARASGVVKRCLVEVSGGLTEENMAESLCPGACRIPHSGSAKLRDCRLSGRCPRSFGASSRYGP